MVSEGKKVGNPFSKVGDLVISDSDDNEVLEDYNETTSHMVLMVLKSASGAGMKSLYEQWKKDTYYQNPYVMIPLMIMV